MKMRVRNQLLFYFAIVISAAASSVAITLTTSSQNRAGYFFNVRAFGAKGDGK